MIEHGLNELNGLNEFVKSVFQIALIQHDHAVKKSKIKNC